MNRPALSIVEQGGVSYRADKRTVQNAEHEKHAFIDGGAEFSEPPIHGAPDILAVWLNDPEWLPHLFSLLSGGCGAATEPGSFNETVWEGRPTRHQQVPVAVAPPTGDVTSRTDATVSPNSNRPSRQTVQAGRDGQREGA